MNWPGKKFLLFGIRKGTENLFSISAHNRIVNFCNALSNLRVVVGERPDFKVSDENAVLTVPRLDNAISSSRQLFRLKSVEADHLVCRTWDGTTEGSSDVLVAKNFKLRNSITSEVLDGTTHDYTYISVVHRESDDGSTVEDQFVVPRYLTDDLIWATEAVTLVEVDDVALTWLDDNRDGRAWATDPDYVAP